MSSAWVSLLVWALVAASGVAWGLKLFVRPAEVPSGAQVADLTPVLQGDLTRLLGADPPPPAAPVEEAAPPPQNRFTLLGVVAPRGSASTRSREGVALIAVDGQTPRAYRVGARVEGDTVLQSVSARGAELGPRGGRTQVALSLPPPPPPATGSLPGAGGGFPAAAAMPLQPAPSPVPPFARPNRPGVPGQVQPQQPLQQPHQGTPAEDPPNEGEPAPQRRPSNRTLM